MPFPVCHLITTHDNRHNVAPEFPYLQCMFIHTGPSGSNGTMGMIRKGSIRNKQLNRQSILKHNHTVRGTASSSASRPVKSSVDEWSSCLTEYAATTTQHEQAAAQRRSDHSTKGQTIHDSQCAPPASAPPHSQTAMLTSVGAPGCRTPTECARTVHVVLYNAVVVP